MLMHSSYHMINALSLMIVVLSLFACALYFSPSLYSVLNTLALSAINCCNQQFRIRRRHFVAWLLLVLEYRGSVFGGMNFMLPFPLTFLEGRMGFKSSFSHYTTRFVSRDQKLYCFVDLDRLIFLFTVAFFIKLYISIGVPVPCHFFSPNYFCIVL